MALYESPTAFYEVGFCGGQPRLATKTLLVVVLLTEEVGWVEIVWVD